jgi:hypothetical protein
MMRTPDGHSRSSPVFAPPAVADHHNAPVNALATSIMFADDIDEPLERLRKRRSARGNVVQYKGPYRLRIRGPKGLPDRPELR